MTSPHVAPIGSVLVPSIPDTPDPSPKARNWWYSADGKRGFHVPSVVAFDYRLGEGGMKSTLYLYVGAGIVHLSGGEADTVHRLVQGKVGRKGS